MEPAPSDESPLVLVVDDYADAREMYAESLSLSGFRVAEAGDGAQALVRARDLLPSVILMDLTLPVLDGLEATRRLKADPLTQTIPIVALTGRSESDQIDAARRAGCVSFLIKPCLLEDLVERIRTALKIRPRE